MTAIAMLVGFVILCNGFVVFQTEHQEGANFTQKWEDYVADAQDTKFGSFMMKTFYFIPTSMSVLSRLERS